MQPTNLDRHAALAAATLFLLLGIAPLGASVEDRTTVNMGAINALNGQFTFNTREPVFPVCNEKAQALVASWAVTETRLTAPGQVRAYEFGMLVTPQSTGTQANTEHYQQTPQPGTVSSTSSTNPRFALPRGNVGEAFTVQLYGKHWDDVRQEPSNFQLSPEVTVVYVDCDVDPPVQGVPMLVCVPFIFSDAGGFDSSEVSGVSCGGDVGAAFCSGDVCTVETEYSCIDAGTWTVTIEGAGTQGSGEAQGSMSCAGDPDDPNDGALVAACTTVNNGTNSVRACQHVGDPGDGEGSCSAGFNGDFEGEVKCEDPPMPGRPGRIIRILINKN